MRHFFSPVVILMQRLRLLPKFALVSAVFVFPLLLATGLLYIELHAGIDKARSELDGIRQLNQLRNVIQLTQQHRSQWHMTLSGNAKMTEGAIETGRHLEAAIHTMDEHAATGLSGAGATWSDVKSAWQALHGSVKGMKPGESLAAHDALVNKLGQVQLQIADRSGLSMDPDISGNRLAGIMLQRFPTLAENLSQIAGRGAAYIDTGLMAPGEDILLHNFVSLTRRDLENLKTQYDILLSQNPSFKPGLEADLASLPQAHDYLERAKNEVLNSYNQTTGKAFYEAGNADVAAMHAGAAAAANALESILQHRISRHQRHQYLVLAGVISALAVATYLLAGFYISFAREVGKLQNAVARLASGDLGSRIHSRASDEIGELVNAFDAMKTDLARLVSHVRASSEAITATSRQIANDNHDLAGRTETQATSLEKTAGSMEELAGTVHQNAATAADANELVVAAAGVAMRGGDAVKSMITTMSDIRASSARIIDIIQVIDSIAFQTNILALNAAVEAARANEQGRGFAVVAAEVRALAQRSAGAAKEIKQLIEHSVEQIENGGTVALAAGDTMNDIVHSVQQVASLMADIASASREQSAGIEQVNQAVGQMDAITQNNAALVEHASDAADSLMEQAGSLALAVSAFRLEETHPAPVDLAAVSQLPLPAGRNRNAASRTLPRA